MSVAEPFFCAEAADARQDPLAGTAPRGAHWALVEYRGAWPADGFEGLALDPEVRAAVFGAAQSLRARILLIRRHGRRRDEGVARWAVLHRRPDGAMRQRWGEWEADRDLLAVVEALRECDWSVGEDAHAPLPGEERSPVVLVCAHGRHDVCCAVRGRPVAERLSERWPELVWECTHVGGDRFAANVMIVPDGVYYGRLDADSAVEVVADHLAGRIRAEHLRGYTDLVPVEQTAVAAVLQSRGPAGRDDYAVVSRTREDASWTIRVADRRGGPVLDVVVEVTKAPPRRLTCRGAGLASALVYTVREAREVAG